MIRLHRRLGLAVAGLLVASALVAVVSEGRGNAPAADPPRLTFAHLPAGTFTLPILPRRTIDVTFTRPALLQTTEVTQAQYLALTGRNPSTHGECGADCPVEMVSWAETITFCNALSRAEGLAPCYEPTACFDAFGETVCKDARVLTESGNPLDCRGYRLPTEAEWLLAATTGSGSFGLPTAPLRRRGAERCTPLAGLERMAWYCANAKETPHPVGTLAANPWGFHDLLGNVEEWLWDWHDKRPELTPSTDPVGPAAGKRRVVRGESVWLDPRRFADKGDRDRKGPTGSNYLIGFRVARTVHDGSAARTGTRAEVTLRPVAPIGKDETACAELHACCAAIPKRKAALRKACRDIADAGDRLGDFAVCRSSLDSYRSACPRAARP